MVHGVRAGEGRSVDAATEEMRGVQRKGPISAKRQTMPPSVCANKCVTLGGTGTDVRAEVGGEEAMVHGVRTGEVRGA